MSLETCVVCGVQFELDADNEEFQLIDNEPYCEECAENIEDEGLFHED